MTAESTVFGFVTNGNVNGIILTSLCIVALDPLRPPRPLLLSPLSTTDTVTAIIRTFLVTWNELTDTLKSRRTALLRKSETYKTTVIDRPVARPAPPCVVVARQSATSTKMGTTFIGPISVNNLTKNPKQMGKLKRARTMASLEVKVGQRQLQTRPKRCVDNMFPDSTPYSSIIQNRHYLPPPLSRVKYVNAVIKLHHNPPIASHNGEK